MHTSALPVFYHSPAPLPPSFPEMVKMRSWGFAAFCCEIFNSGSFCRLRRSPVKEELIMVRHANKYVDGEHYSSVKAEEVFI